MKFLCIPCDQAMEFVATEGPEAGSLAVTFGCARCGDQVALLTNPAETQLLIALGIKIGGRTIPPESMEVVRDTLARGREGSFHAPEGEPAWTEAAEQRLAAAPVFVENMIRRLYSDYARQRGIKEITPEVMNEARQALGLEGM